ncbi:diaminopimelate epimerase [Clostridia bacterium]|nr:diaminopimelate epimerase [Clostridia bacterium]
MKFTKMQGIGNDYIYVNAFTETVSNPGELSIRLSDRHFGVGSDGLILIKPSKVADFEMEMYNADGSRSQMCGNGIRCVGKYVYDYGLTDKTTITIDTLAGIKELILTVENAKVSLVRVDMGEPILEGKKIPVLPEDSTGLNQGAIPQEWEQVDPRADYRNLDQIAEQTVIAKPLDVLGKSYTMTCVSMGNPHCIIFCEEDVRTLALEKIGPNFENHPRFPERINTEFVNVLDENTLRMRVWERGSGETLACGTGACAVAVAAMLNKYTKRSVTVQLTGGDLQITWDEETNHVFMTGAAEIVFDGEIEI